MKKLSLKPNAFSKGEVLTRAQLKKVMGGNGSDEAGGDTSKVEACMGMHEGDYCVWSSGGTPYGGYCRSFIAGPLHCSDLI